MRRTILSAAAPACLLIGLTPVAATADIAPPGSSTATAARVADLIAVSQSSANADQTKTDAQATALSVQGKAVPGTSGSQSGEGENQGALIDTGPQQAPRVRVAPWKARASGAKGSEKRTSSASAALVDVEIPDTVKVGLLTSEAAAEHTPTQSTGTSTSNAADISVGNSLRLVLLHSEVQSNAKGNSYLVGLNGTKIGTQEQLNSVCTLDVTGVAALSCLTASGGTANGITTGAAEVLGVETALGLNPASAFSTTGSMASGTIAPSILESVAAAVPAVEAPRAAAAVPPAGELPRTGVAAASLASSAAAALISGLSLRGLSRRRRRAA